MPRLKNQSIRTIDSVLPKIIELILSNASNFHRTHEMRYSNVSENWRSIYTVLLKIKAGKRTTVSELKELKAASNSMDVLIEVIDNLRSPTNTMILYAAKRRFTEKANLGTGINILPMLNTEDDNENIDEKENKICPK